MIENTESSYVPMTDTEKALDYIHKAAFSFYLTGSRFFRTYTKDSDWDFFVEDNAYLIAEMKKMGFKPVATGYNDPLCVGVFQLGNVHVQLVSNAKKKNTAQQALVNSKAMSKIRTFVSSFVTPNNPACVKNCIKCLEKITWEAAIAAINKDRETNR